MRILFFVGGEGPRQGEKTVAFQINSHWSYKHNKLNGKTYESRDEAEVAIARGPSSLVLVEVDTEHRAEWLVYDTEEDAEADRDGSRAVAAIRELRVTDDQIEQLKTEAARAGDLEQVRICERALRGNVQAREECERVIRAAKAMED